MRIIRTPRLRLEPVTPRNAPALWAVLQAPDLRDFQDLPDLDLPQFVKAVAARPVRLERGASGRFEWLMYYDAPDAPQEPLGWISLRIAERTYSTAEVGYSVVKAYRRRGIASEAVAAMIDEGFREAGLRRIRAYCVPENRSSRAVLRHNLFRDDGMLPHGATVQGHPVDVIAFSIERDAWESRVGQGRHANVSAGDGPLRRT